MVKNFNHQKTIGIIGATPDASAFILKANKLGFQTYLLCEPQTKGKEFFGADKVFTGTLDDLDIIENYLMKIDFLAYFDYSISAKQLEEAKKTVIIPQDEELLAISRDRVLQKAFKESLEIHIAPYETIVKPEDIKSSIRRIGYPAVLRTNYLNHEKNQDAFFIYDETDIEEAQKTVEYGTYVLESWITPKDELSITLVKTNSGETQLFPIVKKKYRNDQLSTIQVPYEINQDLQEEIERVALVLADNIDFSGVLTIDFIVSPADTLYIGSIHPFPNILTRYSDELTNISIVGAHLRAVASLPLPEIKTNNEMFIYIPFYYEQIEAINELMFIHPDWKFTFYPCTKETLVEEDHAIGHIIIRTEDTQKTLDILKEYDL